MSTFNLFFFFSATRNCNYWRLHILGHDNSTFVLQKVSFRQNISQKNGIAILRFARYSICYHCRTNTEHSHFRSETNTCYGGWRSTSPLSTLSYPRTGLMGLGHSLSKSFVSSMPRRPRLSGISPSTIRSANFNVVHPNNET